MHQLGKRYKIEWQEQPFTKQHVREFTMPEHSAFNCVQAGLLSALVTSNSVTTLFFANRKPPLHLLGGALLVLVELKITTS